MAQEDLFDTLRLHMEWRISDTLVNYPDALETMETRVSDIIGGKAGELAWLVEHPPLYTAGTSAKSSELLSSVPFPVYTAGRGGQWTYHGPGQRVGYLMLDLKKRRMMDVRRYVHSLEQWLIATLDTFGIEGFVREGRVGVWVNVPNGGDSGRTYEAKIAALGIRVRKWVTYHGVSLNVAPDLSHYAGIVPCGIREHGVTSLAALGVNASMAEVDGVLEKEFYSSFPEFRQEAKL